ncbi:hypothetical protein HK098_001026 [Nowakowskiella sp. JEL0407]|nr:hypothetical protein HK098_001026 [Nowakowskiella sp. JEL0407]
MTSLGKKTEDFNSIQADFDMQSNWMNSNIVHLPPELVQRVITWLPLHDGVNLLQTSTYFFKLSLFIPDEKFEAAINDAAGNPDFLLCSPIGKTLISDILFLSSRMNGTATEKHCKRIYQLLRRDLQQSRPLIPKVVMQVLEGCNMALDPIFVKILIQTSIKQGSWQMLRDVFEKLRMNRNEGWSDSKFAYQLRYSLIYASGTQESQLICEIVGYVEEVGIQYLELLTEVLINAVRDRDAATLEFGLRRFVDKGHHLDPIVFQNLRNITVGRGDQHILEILDQYSLIMFAPSLENVFDFPTFETVYK